MITIIQEPQKIQPVYNQLVVVLDSDLKTQPSFRYKVRVYDKDSNLLDTWKVAPEPTNGYGYVDLSKVLSNYLTWDMDFTSSKILASNSHMKYSIEFDEEFLYEWEFTDTVAGVGAGRTRLVGTISHLYSIGDQISARTYGGLTAATFDFDGLFTIVDITTVDSVVIEITHISTADNPGITSFANREKTLIASTASVVDKWIWNGALSFKDFQSYDYLDWTIPQSPVGTRNLLTYQPTNFQATLSQDIWTNLFKDPVDTVVTNIRFLNSKGHLYQRVGHATADAPNQLNMIGVGPNNYGTLTQIAGATESLVADGVEWYEYYLQTTASTQLTKRYRIYLDRRCKIFDYEILFQDRLGSFSSFAFQMMAEESGSVQKERYNKFLGTVNGSGWSYQLGDNGEEIYHVEVNKTLLLRTAYLTGEQIEYFEQLYTSPVTFIKIDGDYYRCTVLDTSFRNESSRQRKLNFKEISVQLANNERINI
jgi:hypothetical protein